MDDPTRTSPHHAASRAIRLTAGALLALASAGCDRRATDRALTVAAIGGEPALATAGRRPLDMPTRLLLDATAQGLVRFDANGQVEPGLAERWIVIDGGRSYIFRLRTARWADGAPVDAGQVARLLGRAIRPARGNPLAPYLTAIDRIVAMTPQVIEVRLNRPRPDLLKLFAQPELAVVRTAPSPSGTGPLRIVAAGQAPLLAAERAVEGEADDEPDDPAARHRVRLIGERAARAIWRFAQGRADLVAGGGFADWPLLATAAIPAPAVRIDPAVGLFGLAIVDRGGFLADRDGRDAVNAAMDRAAITAAVAPAWDPVDRLLPDGLDSAAPPHVAPWTLLTLDERRAAARARVAAWRDGPVVLRIALPDGPGATRLWAAIAASLRAVGIGAERVALDASADLRLVDAVAPYDNARWYLATACRPCGAVAAARIEAARTAPTLETRAQATAEADAALGEDVAFIPLARPLRWSLVAPALTAWSANPRAWHPLNRLRTDPN